MLDSTVLDIGCGTGTLACRLAARGLTVTGVDPAQASLDVARSKPGADRVIWLLGDATTLAPMTVDVVTMTGNVAQVFVSDGAWAVTLASAHARLRGGGHLVFETRDPAFRGWEQWTRAQSIAVTDTVAGRVEHLGRGHRCGRAVRLVPTHVPVHRGGVSSIWRRSPGCATSTASTNRVVSARSHASTNRSLAAARIDFEEGLQ